MFSKYDHRYHTSNRILFMPFHPLVHTFSFTNENSGKYHSHSFDEDHSYKTFLDSHFVFGVSNIVVWLLLSVAEGIVRKLAKCLYLHGKEASDLLLDLGLFHISSLNLCDAHGDERRDSTKDSWQGHFI